MNDIKRVLIENFNLSEETADDIIAANFPRVPTHIPCEIYSRVVGYFRPVANWNPGKKEEFRERTEYHQKKFERGC